MAKRDLTALLGSSLDTAAATADRSHDDRQRSTETMFPERHVSADPTPAAQPSTQPSTQAANDSAAATTTTGQGSGGVGSRRRRPAVSAAVPASAGHGPRYLELDRKELRIRGDQADELSGLTRQLNRARAGTGERITDNTLIRVAIDVLLLQRSHIAGTTEAELLNSVLRD